MIRYPHEADPGALEDWPFAPGPSDYVIVAGDPRASGRIDAGGPGHVTRTGIWRCTPGVFDCTEQGDELMTVLSGRARLTDLGTGETVELHPGVSHFVRDGTRARWDVAETLVKVFHAHKTDGY